MSSSTVTLLQPLEAITCKHASLQPLKDFDPLHSFAMWLMQITTLWLLRALLTAAPTSPSLHGCFLLAGPLAYLWILWSKVNRNWTKTLLRRNKNYNWEKYRPFKALCVRVRWRRRPWECTERNQTGSSLCHTGVGTFTLCLARCQ